jgi:hypothetical protein
VDRSVGGDGAVDGHVQAVAFRPCDDNTLDGEVGIIELALGNLGDGNEEAMVTRQFLILES